MKEPLVIYIIGNNRSGSTLLDYLLSCHPEAFSVGELRHLHSYFLKDKGMGVIYDWNCSCGAPVQKCEFWNQVLKNVSFDENYKTQIEAAAITTFEHLKHIIRKTCLKGYITDKETYKKGIQFSEQTWSLYKEIFKITGKSIIVDSSKNAREAFFLNKYKKGNIKFILLERDLRAVAFSKYKRTTGLPQRIREFWHPKEQSIKEHLRSSYKKRQINRKIVKSIQRQHSEKVIKKVKYYELTREPRKIIRDICRLWGLGRYNVPTKTGKYKNEEIHALCGSPSRFKEREIKPDNRWKKNYKKSDIEYIWGGVLEHL